MEPVSPNMEPDARINDSVSSASSSDSQGFAVCKKTASLSVLSKQSSKLKLEKKREKRWKKNKIGKEDFYNKTAEFRTWLTEKKNVQLDSMSTPKAKKTFKKFIKKWNGKKLDQKYYSGLGVYWAAASPSAYSHSSVPVISDERAKEKLKASTFTPLYEQDFSTFGKKEGLRALQELQRMQADLTPTRPEEHVYDVPGSAASSYVEGQDPGYATVRRGCAIKPRPALSQLFLRPGETNTSRLESDEEPVFAKVTRQRPLSCHGRVQKQPVKPHLPFGPAEVSSGGNMRPLADKPPRPVTEYHGTHSSFGHMRRKPCSTLSTSSTDSDVSISTSTDSARSSLSSLSSVSDRQSVTSDTEYVSFGARHCANGEYVALQPKPPPRSSSIGSRSQQLREVAQVVVSKATATPAKVEKPLLMKMTTPGKVLEAPEFSCSDGGVIKPPHGLDMSTPVAKVSAVVPPPPAGSCSLQSKELREVSRVVLSKVGMTPVQGHQKVNVMTPGYATPTNVVSPPPPPPPSTHTPNQLNQSTELLPPPPQFGDTGMAIFSPTFPPPPSPLEETRKEVSQSRPAVEQPQEAVQRLTASKITSSQSLPPESLLRSGLAGRKPADQDRMAQHTMAAQQYLMTPSQNASSGPASSSRHAAGSKLRKRPSSEALESYNGVTPAKKMDLDISYKSSFV